MMDDFISLEERLQLYNDNVEAYFNEIHNQFEEIAKVLLHIRLVNEKLPSESRDYSSQYIRSQKLLKDFVPHLIEEIEDFVDEHRDKTPN